MNPSRGNTPFMKFRMEYEARHLNSSKKEAFRGILGLDAEQEHYGL